MTEHASGDHEPRADTDAVVWQLPQRLPQGVEQQHEVERVFPTARELDEREVDRVRRPERLRLGAAVLGQCLLPVNRLNPVLGDPSAGPALTFRRPGGDAGELGLNLSPATVE